MQGGFFEEKPIRLLLPVYSHCETAGGHDLRARIYGLTADACLALDEIREQFQERYVDSE